MCNSVCKVNIFCRKARIPPSVLNKFNSPVIRACFLKNFANFAGMKKGIRITAIIIFVAVAGCGAWLYSTAFKRFDGNDTAKLYIPESVEKDSLKHLLNKSLGDDFGDRVYTIFSLRDGDAGRAHGYYEVKPGDRAWSVANRIRTGTQTPRKVTFNNIRTMDQLAERLADKFEWRETEFLEAADTLLPTMGFTRKEWFPAAFVPDSYEFYYTDSPERVIRKLVEYRNKFWTDERRKKAESLGLNPVQTATLASITEEETAKTDERGKVARLYLNRLDKGMKLQADPTVKFALKDFSIRRVLKSMLGINSPYNTYNVNGLPPGPIRIADKSAIDAVLNAPRHNYLYMCAKSDFSGYHDFSTDYDTHLAFARAYQQKLNELNIK